MAPSISPSAVELPCVAVFLEPGALRVFVPTWQLKKNWRVRGLLHTPSQLENGKKITTYDCRCAGPRPPLCGSLKAGLVWQEGSCLIFSGEMEANKSEGVMSERMAPVHGASVGRGSNTVRRGLHSQLFPRPAGIPAFGTLQLHFP